MRFIGLDVLAYPGAAAVRQAMDTGEIAASGKLMRPSEPDRPAAYRVVMFAPVYRRGTHPRNIRDRRRDIVGFVNDIKASIAKNIKLPPGYNITYGGQFEDEQQAAARLELGVPLSIVLLFIMLFSTFGSVRQASLILLNIPFAMIGGVISLYLSGLYMSVPASVGFITLFGVAVLNGVVMVSYFNQLRDAGVGVLDAVQQGAERRLRPVLMTAMIASLGLLPLLTATGIGSELQKPLAVVVIGGLVTSTLLTLLLLPMLYAWVEGRAERKLDEGEEGRP